MENFDGKRMKDFKKVKIDNLAFLGTFSCVACLIYVCSLFTNFSLMQQTMLDVRKTIASKLFFHPLNKVFPADVHKAIIAA